MAVHASRLINVGGVDFKPTVWRLAPHKCRPTHICDVLYRLPFSQPVRNLNDGSLGIAVQ